MTREDIKNRVANMLQAVKDKATQEEAQSYLANELGNIIADAVAGVLTNINGYAYVDINKYHLDQITTSADPAKFYRQYGKVYIGPDHPIE